MALNSMGGRAKYKYTMDDGTVIKLKLDKTYGDLAACGLTTLTASDNAGNKPTGFKPRVVYWQSNEEQTDGEGATTINKIARREFVCASNAPAYISVDQYELTVDGIAGYTTGRRGEVISF